MKYSKVKQGHILLIDPKVTKFDVVKKRGGIKKIGQHAQRLAKADHSFAINGTFFYSGRVLGDLLQLSGRFSATTEPKNKKRYGFSITTFNAPTIYNRQVLLGTGSELEMQFKQMYSMAIGGLGRLIEDGKNVASRAILMDSNGQHFQEDAIRKTKRPAIGIDSSGKIMIFISNPMSPEDVANFMLGYKVTDAVFLDGRGSTSFAFKKEVLEVGGNDSSIPCWVIGYE